MVNEGYIIRRDVMYSIAWACTSSTSCVYYAVSQLGLRHRLTKVIRLEGGSNCDAMLETDVVIIGAGPAGLSALKTLNDCDIRCVLLARESSPGEAKACGGFIPARCFLEFDLRQFTGCRKISGVRMMFPGLEPCVVDLHEIAGYNSSRFHLGRALLEWAGHGESEVRLNTGVGLVRVERDGCSVICRSASEQYTLHARIIVDASGVSPVSMKSGLVRDRLSDKQLGYAVQYQMTIPSNEPDLEGINSFLYGNEHSPGGYAWMFPRQREAVIGTGGLVSRVRSSGVNLYTYLDSMLQNVEPMRTELGHGELTKREAALLPLSGVVRPSYSDRVLLAGDAAGHCSPITGEGIFYAMLGGRIAAEVAADAVLRSDFSSERLAAYERRWMKAMGSDLKWGLWLQERFTRPGTGTSKAGFLHSERSRRIVAEMLVGKRSVRGAILSAAPGYLRSRIA